MFSKILGLGVISTLASAAVFAEPPIQPGDTLESLSKAKVTTTVNGQPGSLQELISNGQIQPVNQPATAPATENAAPKAATESAPMINPNAAAEAMPELPSSADAPVNAEMPTAGMDDAPIQAAPEAPTLAELETPAQ